MADRPAAPSGWNVINQNKPNEYSAEWDYQGTRYATVTDVTTGQRWLYEVSPAGVPGVVSGGRTLISTTTSDGEVTQGPGYNTIVESGGQTLYKNLDSQNKSNSSKVITAVGTDAEKAKIGATPQYKSTPVGQNTEKVDLTDPNNSLFGTGQTRGNNAGLPGAGGGLRYPSDMSSEQDCIEFQMIEYSPRALTGVTDAGGGTNISGFADRRGTGSAASQGTVTMAITGGISDLNSVTWGSADISPMDAAKASAFLTALKEGGGAAVENMQKQAQAATGNPETANQVKTALAAVLTDAAINKPGTLSRATGAIINPNTELLFQGVTLRPFTFNFRMSARSDAEAKEIKKIIFFFKKGMAAKRSKSGLFLKAPNTFVIKYKHGANEHKAMNKIKECALLSCMVNYVPDGQYAAHADGNLTAYEMQLQFTELEPLFFDEYTGSDNIGY